MKRAIGISARSWVALGLVTVLAVMAFGWPLLLRPDAALNASPVAPLMFALVLPVVLVVVLVQLSADDLDAKALAMLGVMTAVVAVVRPLGAGTAGIELVFAPIILAGRVFGPGFGFVLGNTGLLASALLTGGVGPWLPYQMVAAGLLGLGAGLLPRCRGWLEIAVLCLYALVSAFAYGWLMDFSSWPFMIGMESELGFDPTASIATNLHHFVLFNLATSMGWNLGRAITGAVVLIVLGPGLLRVLRRAARRAHFD